MTKTIFEISKEKHKTNYLPELDIPEKENLIPKELLRKENSLPELNEVETIRHYTALSKRNFVSWSRTRTAAAIKIKSCENNFLFFKTT